MQYPLAYFIRKTSKGDYEFKRFAYPEEGDALFNVKISKLLRNAFSFIPGKIMRFEIEGDAKEDKKIVEWNVYTNSLGHTYLYCNDSNSVAYFHNDGTVHYFTSFSGDRTSLLYYFYLGAYKVMLGFYKKVKIQDVIPLQMVDSGAGMYLQDFLAPFKVYRKIDYNLEYISVDNSMRPAKMKLQARVDKNVFGNVAESFVFDIVVGVNNIDRFIVQFRGKKLIARQLDEYVSEDAEVFQNELTE